MRKILTIAAALAALSAAPAFAGEGSFVPTAVASPATGQAVDRGTGASFVFSPAAGNYGDIASPVVGQAARMPARLSGFGFNTGITAG